MALAVVLPLVLRGQPQLVTLATNILILALLAVSFEVCWGYAGIMSFGQALFFGVASYAVALIGRDLAFSQLAVTLPLATLIGSGLSLLFACFLLLGRKTPTVIVVSLGTLTGAYAAERLVSGWQTVGAGNGLSSVKLMQFGISGFVVSADFYFLVLVLAGMRQNEERLAFWATGCNVTRPPPLRWPVPLLACLARCLRTTRASPARVTWGRAGPPRRCCIACLAARAH